MKLGHRTSLAVVFVGVSALAQPPKTPPPTIEPGAAQLLRKMSDFLARAQAFTVDTNATDEVVLTSGQKIQSLSQSKLSVKRPNRLRSERVGPVAQMTLYYNGKTLSLFGHKLNMYATVPAPDTLDETIDMAREQYGLEAPGADLLSSDVYKALMDGVTSAVDIGVEPVDGVPCHHLAFRAPEVDFQIWVEDGAQPVPHRYVITSKTEKGQPQFTVQMSRWDTRANLRDEIFEFRPPPDAKKIPLLVRQRPQQSSKR
jgi:hypothetical protein